MSWWYSAVLVIPLILWTGDLLFGLGPSGDEPNLTIAVRSQVDDAAIVGASVALGQAVAQTDGDGEATFLRPDGQTVVQVTADGYEPVYGTVGGGYASHQSVVLRPAAVAAVRAEPTAPPSEVPAPAQTAGQSATAAPPSTATGASAPADSDVVASGKVVGADGEPVYQALVRAGTAFTRTKRDGTFALKGADVSGGLIVAASGYAKQEAAAGLDLTITMERQEIKAVYLAGPKAGDAAFVDDLIGLIDRTEINAVVIDIKENVIFYDTRVQFFRDADAVQTTYDPAALVKKFHDRGIYTIARLVVFNDPLVAQAYPELAVKSENGGLWLGASGTPWVNPFNKELWQPNIDLAVEAAGFGFDEIQYDYVRFPSDGDLSTADFGPDYSEEGRVGAIVDFLKESRNALAPTGALLGADIFGIVAVYGDDQGIGQRTADIAKVVDYVCPMIYPSHFDESSIDVGGDPNAKPYDTIALSVRLALEKMPGMELKLRPWLQDFTLGDPPYGPDEVRAQIDAAESYEVSGWLLWNASSEYTEDALKAE